MARSAGMNEARSDAASRISGAVTSTTGSRPVHAVQDALQELPGANGQQQADPDADGRDAAALSQHLPQQGAWLCADGDPDAELARPARDDDDLTPYTPRTASSSAMPPNAENTPAPARRSVASRDPRRDDPAMSRH